MRCFEMPDDALKEAISNAINNNKRCFEMLSSSLSNRNFLDKQ